MFAFNRSVVPMVFVATGLFAGWGGCVGENPTPAAQDASSPPPPTDGSTPREDASAPPVDASVPDSAKPDVVVDAAPAPACDPTRDFGAPVAVAGMPDGIISARFSPDELKAYISKPCGAACPTDPAAEDVYLTTRTSTTSPFGALGAVAPVNSPTAADIHPTLTEDGKVMILSTRASDTGTLSPSFHLRRYLDTGGGFLANPGYAVATDASSAEIQPYLVSNTQTLYYAAIKPTTGGRHVLFRAIRTSDAYPTPVELTALNGTANEAQFPVATADDSVVYFSSNRPAGGGGGFDIWRAAGTGGGVFTSIVALPGLSSPALDWPTWISPDTCRLYLISDRATAGTYKLYLATKPK